MSAPKQWTTALLMVVPPALLAASPPPPPPPPPSADEQLAELEACVALLEGKGPAEPCPWLEGETKAQRYYGIYYSLHRALHARK